MKPIPLIKDGSNMIFGRSKIHHFLTHPLHKNINNLISLFFFLITRRFHIPAIRRTLADFNDRSSIDSNSNYLKIDETIISVAYFRAGYNPSDYPTSAEWNGRSKVENSKTICCPSVLQQMLGSKKLQQMLTEPNTLERFVRNFATKI